MKKAAKASISLILSFIIIISTCILPALASATSTSAANTEKEEVVYINLQDDGNIDKVYVVNIFDLAEDGIITDYGNYSNIRNMTTNDEIKTNGDKITIDAKKGKLYYEGTSETTQIPWNISIKYFLDGKEYSADEIAGKSGQLEIKIIIKQNSTVDDSFFNNYALQANITLDGAKCTNIQSDGATIANVGSDKQLTYIIMPKNEKEISIKADVKDFEMDPIEINGVLMSLDIDVDTAEMTDKVTELQDGIEKLDNGANDLNNGISQLESSAKNELQSGAQSLANGAGEIKDGTKQFADASEQLESGASQLANGAASLSDGTSSLSDGIKQVQNGLDSLNSNTSTIKNGSAQINSALQKIQSAINSINISNDKLIELISASSQIKKAIDDLVSGADNLKNMLSVSAYKNTMEQDGLDIDSLKEQNNLAVQNINKQIKDLQSMIDSLPSEGYEDQIAKLNEQINNLKQISELLIGNNSAITGTEQYFNGLSVASDNLYEGLVELQKDYNIFNASINDLSNTLNLLLYGMSILADGINEIADNYEVLDNGISDYTSGVSQIVSGYSALTDGANTVSEASQQLKNGSTDLYNATKDIKTNANNLYSGSLSIFEGANKLNNGTDELINGIESISDGSQELSNGTSEFKNKTSDLDSQIDNEIDNIITDITGNSENIKSFISNKNTNIKSVQFVIKTSSIVKTDDNTQITEETEPQLTWWQRLLSLFGLYK